MVIKKSDKSAKKYMAVFQKDNGNNGKECNKFETRHPELEAPQKIQ